jgi:hypothetical protein
MTRRWHASSLRGNPPGCRPCRATGRRVWRCVKDDYAALQAHVETEDQERARTVQRQFAAGDMTPNERAAVLAAANQAALDGKHAPQRHSSQRHGTEDPNHQDQGHADHYHP